LSFARGVPEGKSLAYMTGYVMGGLFFGGLLGWILGKMIRG
jgi:hypothetical protein